MLGNMILYTENSKVSTQKLRELIIKFSSVVEYKIKIEKFVAFLYINKDIPEKKSKKKKKRKKERKNTLKKLLQKKHLGINLTKKVKDLYAKNYETLIKEIEND